MVFFALVFSSLVYAGYAMNPLNPTNGFTYTIEAVREQAWPNCAYRFLSYASTCDKVDMWNAAGANQHWQFISTGDGDNYFYLKSNCGFYLSYPATCEDTTTIDLWSQAGTNQKFRFIQGDNTQFQWYVEAVGRSACSNRYLSFPVGCSTSSPDIVDFWSATGTDQRFRLIPISTTSPMKHPSGTSFICADPFVWSTSSAIAAGTASNSSSSSSSSSKSLTAANALCTYQIACTGGGIKLGCTTNLNLDPATTVFTYQGDALGGPDLSTSWAAVNVDDSRWAPENYAVSTYNYLFLSDSIPSDNNVHRIGYAISTVGDAQVSSYTNFPPSYLNLGEQPGGDIDGHIFKDPTNGRTYLLWKTDDNNVGSMTTRLWIQELVFDGLNVIQKDSPRVILDSSGLWWVDSWVTNGGSLIEGPEMVYRQGVYYLFFAAGRFCQESYAEGVARSTQGIYGPYEKMGLPLLNTGMVGMSMNSNTNNWEQLIGPGHATFIQVGNSQQKDKKGEVIMMVNGSSEESWRILWHASHVTGQCDRQVYVNELIFGTDGWPYVNF